MFVREGGGSTGPSVSVKLQTPVTPPTTQAHLPLEGKDFRVLLLVLETRRRWGKNQRAEAIGKLKTITTKLLRGAWVWLGFISPPLVLLSVW